MYLGLAHLEQLVQNPEIPAIAETFPDFDVNARWDFYAPAETPPEVVRKLRSSKI
jgi:hypothetical protein